MTAWLIDTTAADRGIIAVANVMELAQGPIREELRTMGDIIRADTIGTISRQSPPRSVSPNPPGRVTGALIASLVTKLAKPAKRGAGLRSYVVSSNLRDRYAFMLESGAPQINLKRRPFLVPAARRHTQEFVQRIEAAIQQAIRQSIP